MKFIMWANINAMIQYLQISKNMLDTFFPVPPQSRQLKPALIPVKRRGCVGPADR